VSATNYLENALLNHLVGNSTLTGDQIHVALATAVTDAEAGTFTEVTNVGTGYARQQADNTKWTTATTGSTTTTGTSIEFPVATAAYGSDVTHVVLTDSGTYGGGNVLLIQALTTPKTVDQDDQFVISAGNLTLALD